MGRDVERQIRRKAKQNWIRKPRALVRQWFRPLRKALRPEDHGDLVKRVNRAEQNVRHLLAARHADLVADAGTRHRMRLNEFSVYSQNGEDGLLLHLFDAIGTHDRRFIEFGIGNPLECNTAHLALDFGWRGLLIDPYSSQVEAAQRVHIEGQRVGVVREMLTPQNINGVFTANGFAGEIDLLSVDVDGNDYWLWEAISVVQPRVVVAEYNASMGPDEALTTPYDENFDRYQNHALGWYHGASLAALASLGRAKGYTLVACESSGFNAFFVRDDLAKDRFEAMSPSAAYYPDARRTRVASVEEQRKSLDGLELVSV
ncbi:MAG: FkbM family methyltransferase [bacterium]|nr:FkbM family methyltransferase [bacterium]